MDEKAEFVICGNELDSNPAEVAPETRDRFVALEMVLATTLSVVTLLVALRLTDVIAFALLILRFTPPLEHSMLLTAEYNAQSPMLEISLALAIRLPL